ncbi:hypothetical protein BFW90_16220 [Pseudomonas fluorescens]|nr:hypothetical protein BFW90_16220 [Pseudomonas fluorescens]
MRDFCFFLYILFRVVRIVPRQWVADAAILHELKKDEILRVRLRSVHSLTDEQFKAEYAVMKALEHRKVIARLPMSFQRNLA